LNANANAPLPTTESCRVGIFQDSVYLSPRRGCSSSSNNGQQQERNESIFGYWLIALLAYNQPTPTSTNILTTTYSLFSSSFCHAVPCADVMRCFSHLHPSVSLSLSLSLSRRYS
jgi:hypothetical protein